MLNALILATVAVTLAVALYPRVLHARTWRATVTPLASIIGSGFLVLGPLLEHGYGGYSPLVMAALCLVAWAFGWAIRFNITREDDRTDLFEALASWSLALAYVVSVAYYLNLFGVFAVDLTPFAGDFEARLTTTAMFLLILAVGWMRGFRALELLETLSVGIKLAIIAGLIVGLLWFNAIEISAGTLAFAPPEITGWHALTLAFGLIVTVQGFETSRYLGQTYDAETRVRTMRLAQAIAAAIYMAYIILIAYAFAEEDVPLSETAIIDMMRVVAPVLPALLVAAALAAQFSAAIADTGGSGGLVAHLTGGQVTQRAGYAILVVAGLAITWSLNVFQIIGYASRAFALYYGLQALVAATKALAENRPVHVAAFSALALLGAAMAVFGESVE